MGRVIVLGSINLDLVSRVETHPVPGETVSGSDCQMLPGGKGANQALAAAQFLDDPSRVIMAGTTGKDAFATPALANLKISGMDLNHLAEVDGSTGIALIAVSKSGENSIIVCPGANAETSSRQVAMTDLQDGDILLTQQEITLEEIWKAHALARSQNAVIIHNAAPATAIPDDAFKNIDYLIINESEAKTIALGMGLNHQGADKCAELIAQMKGVFVILTLGPRGATTFSNGETATYPAQKVDVVDTTGAGDTFCGVFAASLAKGENVPDAIKRAVRAASGSCLFHGAQRTA